MPEPAATVALRATTEEIGRALEALRAFGTEHGIEHETVEDLAVALDEILANVVHHGYGDDPAGTMTVCLRRLPGMVTVEVRDRARAYDPRDAPMPELDRPLDQRAAGGAGVHLVRRLVDAIEYARVGDENRLTLTKRRPLGAFRRPLP